MSPLSNIHILPLVILSTSLTLISASASASPESTSTSTSSPSPSSSSTGTHMHINATNSTDQHTDVSHTLGATAQLDLTIGIVLGGILLVVSFLLIYRYALRPRSYVLSSHTPLPSSSSSCSQSTHVIDLEQPFLDQHPNQDDVALQITPSDTQ